MQDLLKMHKQALEQKVIMQRVSALEGHLLEGHAHLLETWDYTKNPQAIKQMTKDYITLVREYVGYVRVTPK